MDSPRTDWREVWSLYAKHGAVFQAVLAELRRRGGTLPSGLGDMDLIHAFLVDRAPRLLSSFQSDTGRMQSYLYVVFRNFVMDVLRREMRREYLLVRHQQGAGASHEQGEEPNNAERRLDRGRAIEVVSHLEEPQRRLLEAYFGPGDESVRETARILGWTRWKTMTTLISLLEQIGQEVEGGARVAWRAGTTGQRRRRGRSK